MTAAKACVGVVTPSITLLGNVKRKLATFFIRKILRLKVEKDFDLS